MGVTIKDNSPEVIKVVGGFTKKGMRSFTEKAHQRIQNKAVVDTGNNKGSIQWDNVGKNSTRIFSGSGYGGYIEIGTSRMQPRPYFQPGIRETISEFQNAGKWS